MHASVGDRLVVRSHHVGNPNREGEIVEIHGQEGAPPYKVRWSDGSESVFTPGSDAIVEHQPASGPSPS